MPIQRPRKPWGAKLHVPPVPHIDGRKATADEIKDLYRWLKQRKTKEWRFKTERECEEFIARNPSPKDGILMSKFESLGTLY